MDWVRRVNEEVLYTTLDVTRVGSADIDWLKAQAAGNSRRRIRLCSHPGPEDALHEMLIVHGAGGYVAPHRHPGKSESFHMIEGAIDVVIFDMDGAVREVVPLGAPGSGRFLYYRLSKPWFHTVIPRSEVAVFHEVTNGPFRREDMVLAPWAPAEDAADGAKAAFLAQVESRLAG